MMKKLIIINCMILIILLFSQCSNESAINHKDLDENMLDMMMYHDNLGLYLREKDADYALWLLDGMDSSLQVISAKFTNHRKLRYPFAKDYEKKLLPPIKGIRKALDENNFTEATRSYRSLTRNCNGCHIDHDIDKVVIDWSDASIH